MGLARGARIEYLPIMTSEERRARRNAQERARHRERMKDPAYREQRRKRNRDRQRRLMEDPEYRRQHADRVRSWHRERLSDPEYRAKFNAGNRERYHRRMRDPDYREGQNAKMRRRRAEDGAYRDRLNAAVRERYHRLGGQGYQRHRDRLLVEQANVCGICGHMLGAAKANVDHIVPVKLWPDGVDGLHDVANLQAAHESCNKSKGDKLLEPVLDGPRIKYWALLRRTGLAQ